MRNYTYLLSTCIALTLLLFLPTESLLAQNKDSKVVQFSGKVVQDIGGEPVAFPFVNVYVANSSRGANTDVNGFFSLVAEKGETIIFSYIGFETAEYLVPEDLDGNWYTLIQTMTADTLWLPETVIYPWPSREFFEIEFLALQPEVELQDAAAQNLNPEILAIIEERTIPDGNETSDLYFKQQAANRYHQGQLKPQNIFNPLAWKKFVEAWKNGDFKKKKN